MSPDLVTAAAGVRSSVVVNEEIRALWWRSGGRLGEVEAGVYRGLVVEWAAAVERERGAVGAV